MRLTVRVRGGLYLPMRVLALADMGGLVSRVSICRTSELTYLHTAGGAPRCTTRNQGCIHVKRPDQGLRFDNCQKKSTNFNVTKKVLTCKIEKISTCEQKNMTDTMLRVSGLTGRCFFSPRRTWGWAAQRAPGAAPQSH